MTQLVIPWFTSSGYGDRMLDLISLVTYARACGYDLYLRWVDFQAMPDFPDVPEWRYQDTKLDNFLSFFKLPAGVTLKYGNAPPSPARWDDYVGFTYSPEAFFDKIASNRVSMSREKWLALAEEVKSEFGLKVPKYVPKQRYAVVHLRRTDKLRGVCDTQVVRDELAFLNQETRAAIQKAKDSGFSDFYIATDDPSSRAEYVSYIESIGGQVIQPENVHGLLSSYFDTWVMRSSSLIIASMRYSTFSLFPSVLWKIPLWTVLPDALHTTKYKYETTYYKNVQLGN